MFVSLLKIMEKFVYVCTLYLVAMWPIVPAVTFILILIFQLLILGQSFTVIQRLEALASIN